MARFAGRCPAGGHVLLKTLGTVSVLLGFTAGALAADVTLGSLRKQYLGQTVIVLSPPITIGSRTGLLHWNVAAPSGSRYKAGVFDFLSEAYKGKTAKVVAVQINEHKFKSQTTNAFGEPISEDSTVDPYVDVVVQFEDGQLAMTTAYPNGLELAIELVSNQQAQQDELTAGLPQLVGKNLYAAGFSLRYQPLFQPETSLDEMLKVAVMNGELVYLGDGMMSSLDVPLLEPLTILAAKYIPEKRGVVLKLKLPSGKEAVTFVDYIHLDRQENKSLFERVAGSYLTAIPSKFTAREIAAIKKGTLFMGMTKSAVEYSGLALLAEKENDWGRGGTQMIFGDSVYVYIDRQDKVVNWQYLNH